MKELGERYHIMISAEEKAESYRLRADECAMFGDKTGNSYWANKAREQESLAETTKRELFSAIAV